MSKIIQIKYIHPHTRTSDALRVDLTFRSFGVGVYRVLARLSFLFLISLFFFGVTGTPLALAQEAEDNGQKAEIEQKIQQLEEEAKTLDIQLQKISSESRSLASETKVLDTEVKKRELEVRRLSLAVSRADIDIGRKNSGISSTIKRIDKNQEALSASLFLLHLYDQESMMVTLFKNKSLSEFFTTVNNVQRTEANIDDKLNELKEDKKNLEDDKIELEDFKGEQENLRALQEVERRFLAQKKKEKDDLLRLTRGKEGTFQQLLSSKKKDITNLRNQLFYLGKAGVSAENAVQAAEFAAKKTGIRVAFLLALLEVETGKQFEDGIITAGTNVGTGNWKKDLYDCYVKLGKTKTAESQKAAFFSIVTSLGLDPDKTPVSRKPNYGCGGAMGAAQFLPTTWLSYAPRVSELTGKAHPSPWNTADAFMAAAVLLADAGADSKTTEGEMRAARVYISGKPDCSKSICKWYSSQIIALAKDIDKVL